MDTWQGALDVAGLVPGLGEPADALNGVIWMMRGDCTAAGLSFAAMVPVAGWAATAGKAGKRAIAHFDVVPYSYQKYAKGTGLNLHHPVLDKWARENIPDFYGTTMRPPNSPTIALRAKPEHEATKEVYRRWLQKKVGKPVGVSPNWGDITPQEIQELTEQMFDAANVPYEARRRYYRAFHQYIYGGTPEWTWQP